MITFISVISAKTKFVIASPIVILAPHAESMSPLIGCSPIAVAAPTVSNIDRAVTATSDSGVCKGPTHCCCAISPVTQRSTCTGKINRHSQYFVKSCRLAWLLKLQ